MFLIVYSRDVRYKKINPSNYNIEVNQIKKNMLPLANPGLEKESSHVLRKVDGIKIMYIFLICFC